MRIAIGLRWIPPEASVAKESAISSGETPTRRPPSPSAGIPSSLLVTPIEWAVRATFWGPTSRSSWANTVLSEATVACCRLTVPM